MSKKIVFFLFLISRTIILSRRKETKTERERQIKCRPLMIKRRQRKPAVIFYWLKKKENKKKLLDK